ncbi:MAG TPA: DUF4157 domain-containing protein [Terriglobia bacterium]|nr:DUF4157 domain-containing protein [Terriglobia bacterium]
MLHAPSSEAKRQTTSPIAPSASQPEHQLHPHLSTVAGPRSAGVASGGPPESKGGPAGRSQVWADLQKTHGNQAVLRMLGSRARTTTAAASAAAGVLQRKCACGGSTQTGEECAECKQKREEGAEGTGGTLTAPIQTKLAVSEPGDHYEQEADRVADHVMRMPDPAGPVVQRQCEKCAEEREPPAVQRVSSGPVVQQTAPPIVHDVLRSPGKPLGGVTRALFEPRSDRDFSHVRVHTGARAAESARAVKALAYTVGRNIVFGEGQHSPHTSDGQHLPAHELVHVVQQQGQSMSSKAPLVMNRLQWKCACGGSGGSGGECAECAEKRGAGVTEEPFHVQVRSSAPPAQSPSFSRGDYKCGCAPNHAANGTGSLKEKTEALKGKEYHCPPASGTLFDIETAGGAGTLGLTKIDKAASKLICAPTFVVNPTAGTCTVKALPVSLSMISKFAPANAKSPTSRTRAVPNCAKSVPVFVNVTSANEALIKAGEQEHCDDHTRAFNLTLKPCSAALNKLDGTDVPGKNEDQCYAAVVAKLGFDPIDCTKEFVALVSKTQDRDDQGMHTFDETQVSANCTEVIDQIQKSSTNKIGDPSVAPAAFIPAATKCGTTSTSPPPPPPPGRRGAGQIPPTTPTSETGELRSLARTVALGAEPDATGAGQAPKVQNQPGIFQQPKGDCDAPTRQSVNMPIPSCCTQSMLQEIWNLRGTAIPICWNAFRKLFKPGGVSAALWDHFRVRPNDTLRVVKIQNQFSSMLDVMVSDRIQFMCRDATDSMCRGFFGFSDQCSSTSPVHIWLCGGYVFATVGGSKFLGEPHWPQTLIHEYAHAGCPAVGAILPAGSEVYASKGGYPPADPDVAIKNADSYANFALAVR